MSGLILFDTGDHRLAPLTDLRAGFELRTGGLTTLERYASGGAVDAVFVPQRIAALVAERIGTPVNTLSDGDAFTFVSGRLTTPAGFDMPDKINTAIATVGRSGRAVIMAARFDRDHADRFVRGRFAAPADVHVHMVDPPARWLDRPYDLIRIYPANLDDDLAAMQSDGRHHILDASHLNAVTIVGRHPVMAGDRVTVHPQVVFDTSAGPIAIEDGAEVRSMSVIVGPSYIGRGSVVTNHAHIRAHTVIGPMCKVGGEVNTALFQGYANKAHGGYLGDSFVGEWANLGAATVTSNLKNTYGEVRMQCDPGPDGDAEPTGMTHLGSIIGDHVKTAIGARLLTGSCIHTGAMLAGSGYAPKCAPPFAFVTDDAPGARYDIDRFLAVADTVMQRRDIQLTDAMRAVLRHLHTPETA
ncbi:MAG: hypothetical protein GC159_00105 [Phycisphaera sp.]|nr:hypothetical protein [Phycisphaera sp.]